MWVLDPLQKCKSGEGGRESRLLKCEKGLEGNPGGKFELRGPEQASDGGEGRSLSLVEAI